MQWLKKNFFPLLACVLAAVILFIQLRPSKDELTKYQLQQLQEQNEPIVAAIDSLKKIVSVPVKKSSTDSTIQVIIEQNNKLLYAINKKTYAHIDTFGTADIKQYFSGLHDLPAE